MTVTITDECTVCGICADECPVEAIAEGDDIFVVDDEECTDCGICIDECPVEAIEE